MDENGRRLPDAAHKGKSPNMPADYATLLHLDAQGPDELQVPDFASLDDDTFADAIRAGMDACRDELAAIASSSQAPTADLLRAWEHAARLLTRAELAFSTAKSADTNPRRDQIMQELSPQLSRLTSSIWLNETLYARFTSLDERAQADEVALDDQDAWLLSETLRLFRRHGVALPASDRETLREIDERLATLGARFDALITAGRAASAVHIADPAGLVGLSDDQIAAAKAAAERFGWTGYALELVNTTGQPLLDHLDNRDTRQLLFEASVGRGRTSETDLRPLIIETAQLRARKAALLGFEHYAAYAADNGCAKTTPAIMHLLTRVAQAADRNARREADVLEARFVELVPDEIFQAWDWQWTAAHPRPSDSADALPDEATLSQYLPFEQVLEHGVFAAATALYGITFARRDDVVGYTPDCRFYEVHDTDGSLMAGVMFDPYARTTKGGGAWMTSLVVQNHLFGELPVVTNNCNLPRPVPGAPTLMTWDEVTTLFHEFGHDLHGMLSDVRYPSVAGTNTPRDFVEYPSQVNEIWAWEPALISQYARHWQTGEPMPTAWVEALAASRHVGEGYAACEIYQAMLLDQAWHQTPLDDLPTDPAEVDAFEEAALQRYGVWFPLVPPRYRSCYFTHIWSHGYAAGYYGYLWSEVMDADTAAWFAEHGGLSRQSGEIFRRQLLAVGGSRDVMAAYRDFRGADPDPVHLLRRRGLETA